ncbi:MAG: nuclease SbcCD subunit [Actinomycetota bacterium]
MRILHTSDWHLGISLGTVSLLEHQADYVDWLVDTVRRERIDLVVIAGDLFDRAIAPKEAVVLFKEALDRLLNTGARVAAITGNHDGADRVANYGGLLDGSGVLIRGGYQAIGEVTTLHFADGPLDLVMLPYLDPQADPDVAADGNDDDSTEARSGELDARVERLLAATHESVLHTAIAAAAGNLRSTRSVAVSHAFVAGGSTTDSERRLTVGGTGTVDVSLYDPFTYTALGHLHRPQAVGDAGRVRYSGTPMSYSFSEEHPKSVTVVNMGADGSFALEHLDVPVGRAVLTVEGTMDDLLKRKPSVAEREAFVRAIITDRAVVLDAKKRLSTVYPNVLEVELQPEGVPQRVDISRAQTGSVSAIDSTEAFWQAVIGQSPNEAERSLLQRAVASAEEVSA